MIKVGITGHRNLKERCVPFYKEQIYKQLKTWKEQYGEVLLYSSLADGADRLVVEIALRLNIPFVAVLPIGKAYYVSDFSEASKIEFDFLLKHASSVVQVQCLEGSADEHTFRKNLYESTGRFISDHSDVLMALWDGKYTNLKGGTGELVAYHLDKKKYRLYHLPVSRHYDLTNDMIEFRIFEK